MEISIFKGIISLRDRDNSKDHPSKWVYSRKCLMFYELSKVYEFKAAFFVRAERGDEIVSQIQVLKSIHMYIRQWFKTFNTIAT